MEKQPKITIKLNKNDKILEFIGICFIIIYWFTIIFSYKFLPEKIPIHYNGLGEVDRYSNKISIFLLPILGSFIYILLSILIKHPETFNYNVKITIENAENQYRNSINLYRILKIIILIVFFLIDLKTLNSSIKESENLGFWFILIMLIMIITPIIYYNYKSYKLK